MNPLILQLGLKLVPAILDMVKKHHASTGALPTDAELIAQFHANIAQYVHEGEDWLAAHPDQP
jgi:hypothetical protein